MSVLGLIMYFSPYLRSAIVRSPFVNGLDLKMSNHFIYDKPICKTNRIHESRCLPIALVVA